MHSDRIVELRFGRQSQGSGYLFTDRHVLTARHVMPAGTRACEVRRRLPDATAHRNATPHWMPASVAWPSDESGLDVAIVVLQKPVMPLPSPDMEWGRISAGDSYPRRFDGVGFPAAAGDASHSMWGQLADIPDAGKLDLHLESSQPQDLRDWGGASGTVVFCGGAAVGVVKTVNRRFDRLLTATPLHQLLADLDFQRWWTLDQNLPLPRCQSLSVVNASLLATVVDRVHRLDRVDILAEVREKIIAATAPKGRGGKILVVPGLEDDLHEKLMQAVAEDARMQRLLEREVRAEDAVIPLHWPREHVVRSPETAFAELLQPMFAAAHLDLQDDPAQEVQRLALEKRLNDGATPLAYWVLLQSGQLGSGHAALLQRLVDFWASLQTRRPVVLFICAAFDTDPLPVSAMSRLLKLIGRTRGPSEADLRPMLERALQGCKGGWAMLPALDCIRARDVSPWINELKQAPGARPADLEVFGASLKLRLAPDGLRLNPLVANLRSLLS